MATITEDRTDVEILTVPEVARRLGVPGKKIRRALDQHPELCRRVRAYRLVLGHDLERLRAVVETSGTPRATDASEEN